MSSTKTEQPTSLTSLSRVSHIPIVSCGMSTVHAKLMSTPIVRTPYAISLEISSRLSQYIIAASSHYPFAPVLSYGDQAANKTLDIAQEKWPYPFKSQPEQVWSDIRSVADTRVVQPAFGVAKSVDQSLAPLVNSFSFVVRKIDANADEKARADDEYQLQRAYALLLVLKDDMVHTANNEENAVVKNIHATLTSLTNQSSALLSAIRSRSEDATNGVQALAHSVLGELEKLSPLLSSLTSNTSTTLKDTTTHLRDILTSSDPLTQKIPKISTTVRDGLWGIVEEVVDKVHVLVNDLRSSPSSSPASSSPGANDSSSPSHHSSGSKREKRGGRRSSMHGVNGSSVSN